MAKRIPITITINPETADAARLFRDATEVSIPDQVEAGLKLYWSSPEGKALMEKAQAIPSSASDFGVESTGSLVETMARQGRVIAELRKDLGKLKEQVTKRGGKKRAD